jgi:hypothetical protein
MTLDLVLFRKVAALLASDHAGERAAAALKAAAMLRAAGKSWAEGGVGAASLRATIIQAEGDAAMAAIYKMSLDSERARTTRQQEEINRLKREVARLKGMWTKEPA